VNDTPQVLLEHYLKQLRLPTMVREYLKLAEQCAREVTTFEQFLLRLVELEMMDRERRSTERRIKSARFPVTKSLETYNLGSIEQPEPLRNPLLCPRTVVLKGAPGERVKGSIERIFGSTRGCATAGRQSTRASGGAGTRIDD